MRKLARAYPVPLRWLTRGLVGDPGLGADVDSGKAARAVTHDPKGKGAGRVCDRGAGAGVGEFREDSTTRRKRSLSVVVEEVSNSGRSYALAAGAAEAGGGLLFALGAATPLARRRSRAR